MKGTLVFTILIAFASATLSQEKKICVTVDDLPVVSYGVTDLPYLRNVTDKLISTFDKYDIPAIGYVNEQKLYVDEILDTARIQLLTSWLKSGYELGNHTFSHKNYHQVSYEDFTQDVLSGEIVTRELMKEFDVTLSYFRHPYLRVGKSLDAYDSLNRFLTQNGYTIAPVTIDNEDYLFAVAYHKAYQRQDSLTMNRIGESYINYMEKKLVYFEQLSKKLFDRNIAQTLLIHANLLNANYLDELSEMYLKKGYAFVTQTEVLEDLSYKEAVTNFKDWGISWIERWAISKGKKGDFFKGDPETPVFIKELGQ